MSVGSRSTKTAGDMLASAGFSEESCEGFVPESLVRRHVAIGVDAMLEAVELPAGVTDLATSLANVDGDTLAHFWKCSFVLKGSLRVRTTLWGRVRLVAPC